MPDQKISQLASGTNAQAGDLFVIARSGANYSLTTAQLFNAPSATATLAALTVDTNTLFVDAANNRVGINTLTPSARLDINTGASASAIVMQAASDTAAQMQLGVGANGGSAPALVSTGNGLQIATTSASAITLFTNSVERLRLDASGNLGIGVTPAAWAVASLQVPQQQAFSQLGYTRNAVWNGSQFDYQTTATALRYELTSAGQHRWYNAPSGTAGGAVTFTQAMTLDASGNLLVGGTTTATTGNSSIIFGGTDAGLLYLSRQTAGTDQLRFYVAGNRLGYFNTASSTVTLGTANYPLVFATNDTARWQINTSGHLLAGADNTYDIGASGATRPRNLYLAGLIRLDSASDASIVSTRTGGASVKIEGGGSFGFVQVTTNHPLQIATNNTERVRVKAEGQVRFVPLAAAPTTNVEDGDVYYDSGTNKLRVRAGGAWVDLH